MSTSAAVATGTLRVSAPADVSAPQPNAESSEISDNPFAQLARYVSAGSTPDTPANGEASAPLISAILLDPTKLSQKRKPCNSSAQTVLIDLDPAQGTFAPGSAINAPAAADTSLARLRERKIEIAWISGASAAYAGDVRVALKESGLDPDGSDALLMMRYPGDRKQTRREDLATTSCVIAIAGDDRRDFDELFAYLVNPEAALGLDLLIGDGWFLIPNLVQSTKSQNPVIANGQAADSQIADRKPTQ